MANSPSLQASVSGLMDALNAAQSAYQLTAYYRQQLLEAGFIDFTHEVIETLSPGTRGFVTQGDAALIAFDLGQAPLDQGFRLMGAHTDSPCLKIKPNPFMKREGFYYLNTEVYGGAILASWFDRPLSLAGRVVFCEGDKLHSRLIDLKQPVLLLPERSIHQNRTINEGQKIERQTQLLPVYALTEALESDASQTDLPNQLLALIAQAAGCDPEAILDYDLYTYDVQGPVRVGLGGQMINAPHLDNAAMCQATLQALIRTPQTPATTVVYLADHEEVGSRSMQGAQSLLLRDFLEQLHRAAKGAPHTFWKRLHQSLMISADQAHSVHPLHPELADPTNRPRMGLGPVIKKAANQSYTSDAHTTALFKLLCAEADVPVQMFVNHSDRPGGSTIGPLTAAYLHAPSVDIGNALWSMHAMRETGSLLDQWLLEQVLTHFVQRDQLPPLTLSR